MSGLGDIIVELIHIYSEDLETEEMMSILVELNDTATRRYKHRGQTDLNDAILEWVRDNFMCEDHEDSPKSDSIVWS